MATVKPSGSTDWATAGTNVLEPTAGYQTNGHPKRAVAPSNVQNGWQKNVGEHLAYLRSQASSFDDIHELVESEDLALGDVGTVRGDASLRPFEAWTKSPEYIDQGGSGQEATLVATDGRRVLVASPTRLWVFHPNTGACLLVVNSVDTPAQGSLAATPVKLLTAGQYAHVLVGTRDDIFDPTKTETAGNVAFPVINSVALDAVYDGQFLYAIDSGKRVTSYSDLTTTIQTRWTNSLLSTTALECIATNGQLVAVGHDFVVGTGNVTLYEADDPTGTPIRTLQIDATNTPTVKHVAFSRHHILIWTDNAKLFIHPAWYDGNSLTNIDDIQIERSGGAVGTEFLEVTPAAIAVSEDYIAQAYNNGTSGYIALFALPQGPGPLMPIWVEVITAVGASGDCISDIALGPDHLVVAHKGPGTTVSCYRLPNAGQPRRYRKTPSTDRFRAPFYGAVVPE